eukprot:440068_1
MTESEVNNIVLCTDYKDIILLSKILRNVLNNPHADKYRNVNFQRVNAKFLDSNACLKLLRYAGFYKSSDGKRLLYAETQSNRLQMIYQKVLSQPFYNCVHLNRMTDAMRQYDKFSKNVNEPVDFDQVDLDTIVHDFIYAVNKHNSDEKFEYIYNRFPRCDVVECKMFKRNHRNRNDVTNKASHAYVLYGNKDEKQILYMQIMDKIHCYYQHSFDTGYRLTVEDHLKMKNVMVPGG